MLERARQAATELKEFTQEQVDRICANVVQAAVSGAEEFARLAVEESGFGRVESKTEKNLFASRDLWAYMRDLRTVGVVRADEANRVYDIAEPYGVIAAICPVTNPTSTAIFKILCAIKTRNAVVLSPHPRARRCIGAVADRLGRVARESGAPAGAVGCLQNVTLEGTQELMRHRLTDLILATGGSGLVRAAYSAGKPAYGVGPGNVPAFIERTADIRQAVRCIVESQTFDYGTICSSEQSLVCEDDIAEQVLAELRAQKAWILSPDEVALLTPVAIKNHVMNPEVVGLAPVRIARLAGFEVPEDTTILVAPTAGVGPDFPLSREILAPILSFFTAPDWKKACDLCIDILKLGGLGHTLVIHSNDESIIWEFAFKKPAMRILVNSPSSQGGVGYSTNLVPSMTLGCGSFGGNITADNIGPLNLINLKRLAFVQPEFARRLSGGAPVPSAASGSSTPTAPPRSESGSAPTGAILPRFEAGGALPVFRRGHFEIPQRRKP